MKTFKKYLKENDLDKLKDLPKVPEDERWLHRSQYQNYNDNPEEVKVRDLGLKMQSDLPNYGKLHGKVNWKRGALRDVPVSEIHYSQPSVNIGKLEHFAKHYNPKPEDFSKWEDVGKEGHDYMAPVVHQMPDGKYRSHDHHRLIASHLRGDKTAIAHVYTYKEDYHRGIRGYSQVPTVPQYKFKKTVKNENN